MVPTIFSRKGEGQSLPMPQQGEPQHSAPAALRMQWLRLVCACLTVQAAICAGVYAYTHHWFAAAAVAPLICMLFLLGRYAALWSARKGVRQAVLAITWAYPLGIQWIAGGFAQSGLVVTVALFAPLAAALLEGNVSCRGWRWLHTAAMCAGMGVEWWLLPAPTGANILILYGVTLVTGWLFSLGLEHTRAQLDAALSQTQRLAQALYETQTDLGTADKVKNDFLASMSHEIRTPMHAISGMADMLLLSEQLGPTEYMQAENIKLASQSLLGLINDILDISKIEAGKLELYEERYDFPSMFHDVVSVISMRARERGLAFLTRTDPDIPKEMIGDSGRIRQVLLNLLGNAVKFTEQGCVTLTVQREYVANQLMLRFEVEDTGVGISTEHMGRLYGLFEQLRSTQHQNRQGTGLGLTISQRLVELMHSELGLHSEVGKGSKFFFTISQQVVNDAPIAMVPNARQKRLLICSDHKAFYENAIEMAAQLKVKAVRGLPTQASGFTHMLLDLSSEAAYAWIRQPTPPGCQRALLIDPATTLTAYIRMSDRVLFHPLHIMAMGAVLNDALTEKTPSPITQTRECLFRTKGARVLLIDDNAVNLMVAENLLKLYEIQVDQATSGEQGIAMLENTAYDIVFVDHIMPGMDGVDTVRAIRGMGGRFAEQVILMLSANVMPESRKLFAKAGVQDMLAKPIELPKLSRLLCEYLPQEKCINPQNTTTHNVFLQARLEHVGQALEPLGLSSTKRLLEGGRIEAVDAYLMELQAAVQKLAPLAQWISDTIFRVSRHKHLRIPLERIGSVLLRMGEHRLSARSKVLYRSLEEGDMAFVAENLHAFSVELESFCEALRVALKQCDIKTLSKPDELQLLRRVHELLLHFEYTEAQEQLTVLRAVCAKVSCEEFNLLHAHLQSFRYGEALQFLERLLAQHFEEEQAVPTAQAPWLPDDLAEAQAMEALPPGNDTRLRNAGVAISDFDIELIRHLGGKSHPPSLRGGGETDEDEIPPEFAAEFDAELAAIQAAEARHVAETKTEGLPPSEKSGVSYVS